MKRYSTKEELINDLKSALKDNNTFDKFILDRISYPSALIREFKVNPNLTLGDRKGNWFFVWKNNVIEINKEWVRVEDLLNRLGELLGESK